MWQRDGLHVRYTVVMLVRERFMLVQPVAGKLRDSLEQQGEGTISRHCYVTPDVEAAYDELACYRCSAGKRKWQAAGARRPSSPRVAHSVVAQALFSIEILEQTPLDAVLRKAFSD